MRFAHTLYTDEKIKFKQSESVGVITAHKKHCWHTIMKANPLLVSSDTIVQMGTGKHTMKTSAKEDTKCYGYFSTA